MRLPTYEEIARDEEQLEVYETPFDESLFVVGPPGSGKTVLAVHRAQMLASDGITVALITYNRMLRRLIAQLTEDQVEAQTMHQFVSTRYLAQANAGAPCTARYPASCITFLSEQAFAPQNTRFWSRRRVWFQFTVGEDKPPMLSVDNRGKGVLSMDCSAKRSPL